jgi:two-component system phosphate regulon sensor histidine kinase PhoR
VPKRLLLALSDAGLSRQIVKKILQPAGYNLSQVHDGENLRAALSAKRLDLLLLGEGLLPGNSFDFVEKLKASHPALPVILLAKRVTREDLVRSIQIGLVDYLALPLDPAATLDAVRRGLERKRLWDSLLRKETGRITGPLTRRLSEMEAILKEVNDGVVVFDKEHHIAMTNQALRTAFALQDPGLLGEPVEQLFKNEELVRMIKDSTVADGRVEVQSPTGHVYDVRVSRIPEVGTVASLHDITKLKEADRLRGDFVNTVSHDLRSPLTAILGYVELIERAGAVNAQQSEFIQRVKSSVHATTNLIDDLLNLGRVEVGLIDEVMPVDIGRIVANAVEGLQSQIQAKHQTLKMQQSAHLAPVLGSRTQLAQVVDNLIANAIKYTQVGGEVRVLVREEQNQLILHVGDNGPGIPLDEQTRIFEKFYRASNVSDSVSGTGLGLAIVKTIVDNHRGRIWVDSKPGEGSVFTVVLPVAKERVAA